MILKAAKSFGFILDNFSFEKSEKQGFVLEGGSGGAKTYDIIQFLMYYCQISTGKDILIFRKTYADLKKTVLKDFIKILRMYDMYDFKLHTRSDPQKYELFGNTIFFTGLDKMGSHGERHDIIWGNEGMQFDQEEFQQLNQRCNEAFFLDYNPIYTEHWIYNSIITRDDTKFCKTTQLDNPFLPKGQRQEILAYEPYEPGSYQIKSNNLMYNGEVVSDKNLPPPHPTNIKNGTADESMWKVYGLGLRGAMKGVIFPYVEYIDKFPDLAHTYGLDFGFTADPTALVKYAEEENKIFLELLCYSPTETADELSGIFEQLEIERILPVIADSSDKHVSEDKGTVEMVRDMRVRNWNVRKVSKKKSVMFWLLSMKKKKIYIVKNKHYNHAKVEQENYRWKEIGGVFINQPDDKFNHFWDAARYAHISHNMNI